MHTIEELIELLQRYPKESEVCIVGLDGPDYWFSGDTAFFPDHTNHAEGETVGLLRLYINPL